MREKVKKALHYLALPVLFIAGLIFGRSFRHDDRIPGDEVDGDIRRAEELAGQAADQLREFEDSVSRIREGVSGSRDELERARDSFKRSADAIDRLRITINGIEGTAREIEEISRRYDELDSESERILQELLRRAGAEAVFNENPEHNPNSADRDSLRDSGDGTGPEMKEV